jgi:hypothetical protein
MVTVVPSSPSSSQAPHVPTSNQVQAAQNQDAHTKALVAAMDAGETKTSPKRYYMPYNGSRFVTKTGKSLFFVGGCLETDIKEEIDQIEAAIKSGAEISRVPMQVVMSDTKIMRDVGASSKGAKTGMASSQTIAALAAESISRK